MSTDFFSIFYWWFLISVLGFFFLPITLTIFKKFFDKGYAFGKIIAILVISYLVWLLGSLRILPFTSETVWLIIIGLAAGNIFLAKKQKIDLKRQIKPIFRIIVFEEILFFLGLSFWAFVRGFQPDIQGLEKFMDYGFVNTILRSRYFPPTDMWLAGETVNYYYFGHLISAVLTKLSGLDSAVTYNLMIATIFALTFTAAFSLGGNLVYLNSKFQASNIKKYLNSKFQIPKSFRFWSLNHWKLFGNCLPAKALAKAGEIGHWKLPVIAGLLTAFLLTLGGNLHPLYWFLKNGNFKAYWYPDSTRFIVELFGAADNTIHEFPIYSFVVADLHSHMINIPNVLLILALTLTLSLAVLSKKKLKELLPVLLLLSACLAVAFMTNAWDFPIYLLVAGGAIFLASKSKLDWQKTIVQSGTIGGILVFGSLIFSLLFHLHFKNIAQGIALTDFHSPPWMLLVLWGWPFFLTIIFFLRLILTKKNNQSFGSAQDKQLAISNVFVIVLLTVSWLLILLPEVIYVKDIYIHSHQRANTMFKLTYQSFVMFSLSAGFILVSFLKNLQKKILRLLILVFSFSFLIFIFVYPRFAILSYYGLKTYQGLDGLKYLERLYPGDYQAILWLKKNVSGQPVIVEAVGESYTDYARISANTGLPTILGWRVHEWLWRGSFDEAGKRTEEVKTIYESADLKATKVLLNQYQAKYIFIGQLEQEQYPLLNEAKFDQFGEVVFISGATKIYRIN